MIEVSEKTLFLLKKAPSTNVWDFQVSLFNLNRVYRKLKFGTFPELACFIFVSNILERLWSYKKNQSTEVSRRLGGVIKNNLFIYKIPEKISRS